MSMNFLAKLFSKKRNPKFVFMRKIALFTPAEENGVAIIAAVGGGRMPKNGDGMTLNLIHSTGLSPVGSAQIVHDSNGGEWSGNYLSKEANDNNQFPKVWSVFNKEASCQ